jgi:electron transfer flavoprotein beta subunit
MRIILPIKQVPNTNAVRMDEETGTMVREGVEAIVNPLDLYGIELAIRLKEQYGGEIIAVTMGPPSAAKALREAMSMGVDTGVLVTDRAFAGADTWSTAYVLAAVVRKIGAFDMVICGERATDGDTGQVGPGLAAFLDLPVATYVSHVEHISETTCRCHRMVEEGYEVLDVQLPAVLTVVKEVSQPRLPTLRGKQRARAAELATYGTADLDVQTEKLGLKGSPTRVVKIFRPKVARECEMIVANGPQAVQQAAERFAGFLREKELI